MTDYIDWVPIQEVQKIKLNECYDVRGTPFVVSSFPDEQHVVMTQGGENLNPDEPMQLELTVANLREAIDAGRVKLDGHFVPEKKEDPQNGPA